MTFSLEQRLRYLADLEHIEENFGSIPPTLLTEAADRIAELEAAVEDAVDTLESMDLHVDNPLYVRLRAVLQAKAEK